MEASAQSLDLSGGLGSLEFITAWELNGQWNEDGAQRQASLRGALRLVASNTGGTDFGSIEYLFYVQTPDGTEASYILSITAESSGPNGTATLEIRGSDGELTCTINSDGSGMCTGAFDHTWTQEEYQGLSSDWYNG